MTRAARPRASLGTVALLAVLAITTGWNLPPSRPAAATHVSVAAVAAALPGDAAAVTPAARERLLEQSRDRAAAWADAWDELAEAAAGANPVQDAAPGETPEETTRLAAAPADPGSRLAPTAVAQAHSGRNHFWIPSLGMSTKIVEFPCPRKRPPDNYMYRWGCAQANNVYILGHAYSVMKPLYNAYMSGRLHVGMIAIYADGSGRIRTYRVTEWRVVDPAEGVHWAIAAQPVPSMTLQTCVGKYSQWRLNVRLVATD